MNGKGRKGFALILIVSLLGLLVLAVYALSVLGRVNSRVAMVKASQSQARQNALLGLQVAMGELQQHAGPDNRITGMAGISGVEAGASQSTRHWAGVWNADGSHLAWLATGETAHVTPTLAGVESMLIAVTNSLGASAADREHIRIVRNSIPTSASARPGSQGYYAYWIGDEGVKLSVALKDDETVVLGSKHAIAVQFSALDPDNRAVQNLLLYEQINLTGATTVQRQGGYHSHTLRHDAVLGTRLVGGLLNVNSTSVRYWRGVAATYNELRSGGAMLNADQFSAVIAPLIAEADPMYGKEAGRPYTTLDSFIQGRALVEALTASGGNLLDFITIMQPWLTLRSDTFRIRAYGDAVNPVDPARVESVAYCEAIVQRTPEELPGFGRRFIVTSFRWLGPEDL